MEPNEVRAKEMAGALLGAGACPEDVVTTLETECALDLLMSTAYVLDICWMRKRASAAA